MSLRPAAASGVQSVSKPTVRELPLFFSWISSLMTRTKIVLWPLVLPLFNHLTRLLAWETFSDFSRRENFRLNISLKRCFQDAVRNLNPYCSCSRNSIHIWRYSPFRALASLIRRLHSCPFSAFRLHPLIPCSCNASLSTTSAHLVLVFPLVLWCRSFRLKPFLESFLLPFLLCELPILIFWF